MEDTAERYFRELSEGGAHPLLARAAGTIRFDLESGKRSRSWLVTVEHSAVSVSKRRGPADCVVRTDDALFEAIARGEANTYAMMLRGRVAAVQDKPELLVLFHRYMRARQHLARQKAPGARAGAGRGRVR
ncbi:hypothetical protein GCM10010124_36130 [Pilimelia terevasa]|uniref:SCP2 domain-containing protein n=1 Tax=Pilimelia terevasa TaxID=53372 RepID=A0A8J3BVM1_9ACTN|nr:SCP2 sterol-binding domain-containing protein [Pilimelia terevasa]GGK40184.1 hypothetical protein GCM10010124_36130 [Pilimelia terevasa]